jgi:hypothetical protein
VRLSILLLFNAAIAQTLPTISGPNGAPSAAFWWLGGVTPDCCGGMPSKYYTVWDIFLTTNTANPNPTVQWSTNSPTKVSITPQGTTGARLTALAPSSHGTTYDIQVFATVDGVQSAAFPVFINTPYEQGQTLPAPFSSCAALFPFDGVPNGWVARRDNSVYDLTGSLIVPINVRETFENNKVPQGTFTSWGLPKEAAWSWAVWDQHRWFDTFAMCWGGSPPPIPPTTSWSLSGNTIINTQTQQYWVGTPEFRGFEGKCTERAATNWYTDHITRTNIVTLLLDPPTSGPCAAGQYAN